MMPFAPLLNNPSARLLLELGDMLQTELDAVVIADIVNKCRPSIAKVTRGLRQKLEAPAAAAAAAEEEEQSEQEASDNGGQEDGDEE
jgi:hypothetical protein